MDSRIVRPGCVQYSDRLEGGQLDVADIGARRGVDKGLEDGEGKVARGAGKEGELVGDFAKNGSVWSADPESEV